VIPFIRSVTEVSIEYNYGQINVLTRKENATSWVSQEPHAP